jgi:hypothetical protein
MAGKIKITEDLSSLFLTSEVLVGAQSITIHPLTLRQYIPLTNKLKQLYKSCTDSGINAENWKAPENLFSIVDIILANFPEVFEEVSGIDREDLLDFPLEILVAVLTKCVEVNASSIQSLLGNSKSLLGMFGLEVKNQVEEQPEQKNENPA